MYCEKIHTPERCANLRIVSLATLHSPPHGPHDMPVRTALPHPCPLPLGASLRSEATAAMEGELSPDGLKGRTISAVQGRNARRSSGKSHPSDFAPAGKHF